MTKQERQEGRQYLHRGDYAKIARAAGVSRVSVTAYADGTHESSVCAPFFVAMVKKRMTEAQQRIKEMLNSNPQ